MFLFDLISWKKFRYHRMIYHISFWFGMLLLYCSIFSFARGWESGNGCIGILRVLLRLSGPQLGRPAKIVNPEFLKQLADNSARNAIEGKFGQCKRRLGLGRVIARRRDCSETVIAMTFLVANLIRWLRNTGTFLLFRFRPLFFMEQEPVIIPFSQNAA